MLMEYFIYKVSKKLHVTLKPSLKCWTANGFAELLFFCLQRVYKSNGRWQGRFLYCWVLELTAAFRSVVI